MSQDEIVTIAGPLSCLIMSITFVSVYVQLQWLRTRWGRAIMISALAAIGLAGNTLLWQFDQLSDRLDVGPLTLWMRTLAWVILAAVYGWKTTVALRALRESDTARD